MSLDIAVLFDPQTIERHVPIGVDAHHRLFAVCQGTELELLRRFADYYQEGEIFHRELPALKEELVKAAALVSGDSELSSIVDKLMSLTDLALAKNRSVVAIPD